LVICVCGEWIIQTINTMSNKTWCYTLNNYTEADIDLVKRWECKRHTCAKEVGDNGTSHLQGAITWNRTYRLAALKKLHPRMHWEIAAAADCFNYCMKDGSEIIIDTRPAEGQGKRNDLKEAIVKLKEDGVKGMITEHAATFVKYHRGLLALKHEWDACTVREAPIVCWLYGATGTGKTRWVFDNEVNLWVSSKDLDWFDGYRAHEAVVFDDFRGDMVKFRFLLRLLDRYPLQVPVKGGFVWWVPKRIYITSCKHPQAVYSEDMFDRDEKVDQLLRRIKVIKAFPWSGTKDELMNENVTESLDLDIFPDEVFVSSSSSKRMKENDEEIDLSTYDDYNY